MPITVSNPESSAARALASVAQRVSERVGAALAR
jgi:hypothetical protein